MSFTVKKVATSVSFALAAAALLVPVTVTSDGGVTENTVCAEGKCCPELGSICGEDTWNAYYSESGRCVKEDN